MQWLARGRARVRGKPPAERGAIRLGGLCLSAGMPAREEERLDLDAHFLWVILPVNKATLGSSREAGYASGTAD